MKLVPIPPYRFFKGVTGDASNLAWNMLDEAQLKSLCHAAGGAMVPLREGEKFLERPRRHVHQMRDGLHALRGRSLSWPLTYSLRW
jgi:hypothetical protein